MKKPILYGLFGTGPSPEFWDKGAPKQRLWPCHPLSVVLVLILSLSVSGPILAVGGVYNQTLHGNPQTGVQRDLSLPRANCAQCHSQHGGSNVPYSFGLFTENLGAARNTVCYTCHSGSGQKGVYQGQVAYQSSVHNLNSYSYWPGPSPPARPASDYGNCANCHNPHGAADSSGLIPALKVAREEALCLTCHDANGPASKDIAREVASIYSHGSSNPAMAGRHTAGEDVTPASFSGALRHVECADCHNVHRIIPSGLHTIGTNVASELLRGVSYLETAYSSTPWTPPSFTPRRGDYIQDMRFEYELCLKCHSSWAYGGSPPIAPSSGVQTDQSVEFNPNNASFHPVVAEIQSNSYTSPSATNGFIETMEPPWDNGKHDTMYCSDCHASETSTEARGSHGSANPYMLIATTSAKDNALCLQCHKAEVYSPSNDPGNDETGSRFDRQTTGRGQASHSYHVTSKQVGCRECHAGAASVGGAFAAGTAHGTQVASKFMNGTRIMSYSPGSCTPTCHGTKSYTAGSE